LFAVVRLQYQKRRRGYEVQGFLNDIQTFPYVLEYRQLTD